MEDTLKFINDVIAQYNERMKSQPYQINLLEEVHMHDDGQRKDLSEAKKLITLFSLTAEDLLEAGASYESVIAIKNIFG